MAWCLRSAHFLHTHWRPAANILRPASCASAEDASSRIVSAFLSSDTKDAAAATSDSESTPESKPRPQEAPRLAPHRFNLDSYENLNVVEEEQVVEEKPSATPLPVPTHVFRQPAQLQDLPSHIRPQFRTPVKKRPAPVGIDRIFRVVKEAAKGRFNESVDVSFKLTIDPRKGNQVVRGSTSLPHGTGKEKRVAVFATGANAAAAREAGAALVGDEELIKQVAEKKGIDADVVVATPDMMAALGKVARILGPKGLMPNPKMGTVTTRVRETVLEQRMGKVQFRNDKGGALSCSIGRIDFDDAHLRENFTTLLAGLIAVKPDSVKGNDISSYIERASFSSTTGRGFPLASSDLSAVGKEATARVNK